MDGAQNAWPTAISCDVAASEYHRRELGVVSKSALDEFARSPQHYRAWLAGTTDEDTPALRFGTAAHMALLEPERYAQTYAVAPDFGDQRTRDGKAAKAAWLAQNEGREMLSADDAHAIQRMMRSIVEHPAASRIMSEGRGEVTLRWTDDVTGLRCKSRADFWVPSRRLAVDFKTTLDASPSEFSRSVARYRYHVQDALYRMAFAACGEQIGHFAILAVEKVEPYAVAVYTLDADAVARGYAAARQGIDNLRHCLTTDAWPGYGNEVQELSLPPWAA